MKKDEMGGACRTHGANDEYIGHNLSVGSHEEKLLLGRSKCR
jgi:hypothetical protein